MVTKVVDAEEQIKGVRLGGKYEVGRTLGEGNFGKVKFAKDVETGQGFALKILEKRRIVDLKITDQVIRISHTESADSNFRKHEETQRFKLTTSNSIDHRSSPFLHPNFNPSDSVVNDEEIMIYHHLNFIMNAQNSFSYSADKERDRDIEDFEAPKCCETS